MKERERSTEEQEQLWRAEQLAHAGLDLDEPHLRHLEKFGRLTLEHAAREVTGDKNPKDAKRRFSEFIDFLQQPGDELTLKELKLRNAMMTELLASLLRIYKATPGVYYQQFCAYLRDYVWPKWVSSPVKKSRVAKKSSKKDLKSTLSDHGKKTPGQRERKRDERGRFSKPR